MQINADLAAVISESIQQYAAPTLYYYLGMAIVVLAVFLFLKTYIEYGMVTFRKTLICLSLIATGYLITSVRGRDDFPVDYSGKIHNVLIKDNFFKTNPQALGYCMSVLRQEYGIAMIVSEDDYELSEKMGIDEYSSQHALFIRLGTGFCKSSSRIHMINSNIREIENVIGHKTQN